MNRLLPLLLLWLSSCASVGHYMARESSGYYTIGNTWAFAGPHTHPIYTLYPGQEVDVVGQRQDWYVVNRGGKLLLIPQYALVPIGTGQPALQSLYIYPHGQFRDGSERVGYSTSSSHQTLTGPRGGEYYINGNGNKTYVTPQSTINRENVQTGPRGGQYYINGSGRKTYIKH